MHYAGPYEVKLNAGPLWQSGQQGRLSVAYGRQKLEYPIRFAISYVDGQGNLQKQEFELHGNHDLRDV